MGRFEGIDKDKENERYGLWIMFGLFGWLCETKVQIDLSIDH